MYRVRSSSHSRAARTACFQFRHDVSRRRMPLTRAMEAEALVAGFDAGDDEEAPDFPVMSPRVLKPKEIPLPTYHLNVLYLDKAIGMAIDQRLASGQTGPVTEYYMWPTGDAWTSIRDALETMPWVSTQFTVDMLNQVTAIINFWQDEQTPHTIDEARQEFPDVTFYGV